MSDKLYEIINISEIYSKKFRVHGKSQLVKINTNILRDIPDVLDILYTINEIFEKVLHELMLNIPDDHEVRLELKCESLKPEVFTPFIPKNSLTTEQLMNEVNKITQSKSEILLDENLMFRVISAPSRHVGGGHPKYMNIDDWIKRSKKVVKIKPDGLCIAKSIIISMAHADGIDEKSWKSLKRDSFKILTNKAIELYKNSYVEYNKNGIDLKDLSKIQDYLSDEYQLIAVTSPDIFLFKGKPAKKQIYIIINNEKNHADSLLSIKAFLKCEHFCIKCFKGYNSVFSHRCVNRCSQCYNNIRCEEETSIYCDDCNRYFVSSHCFQRHIEKKICERRKFCKYCRTFYQKKHICGKKICTNCKELVDISNHFCYIMPLDRNKIKKEDEILKIFIFFDIETYLSPNITGLTHKANQLCCSVVCDKCWDFSSKKKLSSCSICTAEDKCWFGLDCVEKFMKFVLNDINTFVSYASKKYFRIICLAHNGKGFDFHFIINNMLKNRQKPKILRRGTKILCLRYKNITFLDSINFIPLPLSKFPSTFSIPNLVKGDFPFDFNRIENWDYVGFLPEIKYYSIERKRKEESERIEKWHKINKHKIFVFKEEIEKYCHNDVVILMTAIMLYRSIWINKYKIDCLTRAITLPSAVIELFKYSYLEPKTLAIIPHRGYESKRKNSYAANVWLDYVENTENIKISREIKIANFFVDGFEKNSNTIFEFLGCYYHGCPSCFPNNRNFKINDRQSFDQLDRKTISRLEFLKKLKYNLKTKRECEWNIEIRKDPNLKFYVTNHLRLTKNKKSIPGLDPRLALMGGRVNGSVLYKKANGDEIFHYDIRSLYPFVNKTCKYPLGHPQIIKKFENFDINKFEGLIFCRILPPQNILFPILGMKIENKLIFTLCNECAFEKIHNCDHDEQQRSLIHVWVIPEVKLALENGYKILEIYTIWHFDRTSNTLFTKFINDCIKGKIEASGWPSHIRTDWEKDKYVKDFEKKEGIFLDKENMLFNPGARFIDKINVNSFWGRFALNLDNLQSTEIITDPDIFFKKWIDPSITIKDINLFDSEILELNYSKKTFLIQDNKNSNVIIANYTTAYARMILYEYLKQLGDRILYYDTDSIIFFAKENDWKPKLGEFIGDLSNEIDDENKTIEEFVCCGAKSYAYSILDRSKNTREYVIKMKGIRLNINTENIISFENLVELVKEYCHDNTCELSLDVEQTNFKTNKFHDVLTQNIFKKLKITYDKRIVLPNFHTRPYGYKLEK